ncbi:MAG: endolytic transglycosylase MltG [Actinobacteria bacterium]|nr:endolytic transglycosylase MltG [Actinomycetota bacterium]
MQQTTKPQSRRLMKVALVLALAILGGIALSQPVITAVQSLISRFSIEDYSGQGQGTVIIVIEEGDLGEDVARKLVAADVVKSFDAIYRPMLQSDLVIFPGHYEFPLQIPGAEALKILMNADPITSSVTIPEGFQIAQIIPLLISELNLSRQDLEEAIERANKDFPGPTLEGYLFPATYQFEPDVTAAEVIEQMTQRMIRELARFEVNLEDSLDLVTLASIIQEEARLKEDFFKVSTVFNNRLKQGMLLQTDPTVKYYYEGSIKSFQQGLADEENPYNTYVYAGLPPGPISSPGSLAIEAALNPAPGNYLFFVSINLNTGETIFSETLREHEKAVELYRKWLRENPGWDD